MRHKLIGCLLATLVLAVPLAAQSPRPRGSLYSLSQIRAHLRTAKFSRTVTVDAGGAGDFATIKAAVDYFAGQTCTSAAPCMALVYPGTYTEENFAVPVNVAVQAVQDSIFLAFHLKTTITNASTSGAAFIICSGTLSGFAVYHTGTLSAPRSIIQNASGGGTCVLKNIDLRWTSSSATHVLTPLDVQGNTSVYYASLASVASGGGSANTTMLKVSGTGVAQVYDAYLNDNGFAAPRGLWVANAGARLDLIKSIVGRVYGTSAFAIDVVNDGGTVWSVGSSYKTTSGTITTTHGWVNADTVRATTAVYSGACPVLSGAGSPEGSLAATVCALYLRTDGGAGTTLCVKESGTGNTGWICK